MNLRDHDCIMENKSFRLLLNQTQADEKMTKIKSEQVNRENSVVLMSVEDLFEEQDVRRCSSYFV